MNLDPDDDLASWFWCSRSRHDVEVEHALAQFEAQVFDRTRPVSLARHVLRRKLGAGAHGVVYEAYDPHLDRKVAIKVLRDHAARHAQLLAEARALARLAHPNVVAVHDIGIEDEGVYIVMELVEGTSLEAWLRTPRPWRHVLRCLVEAGRGLQAAHRAGLVHRDFKPANVLIGHDGAVKVTDFGLATPPSSASSRPLSRAGTPMYMAPELIDPACAGPASDQYAFCVTAWEALCGESAVSGVPRALLRDLRRGLHRDPAQRWPSLEMLLDRLEASSRRRVRGLAGIFVAMLGLIVAAWSLPPSASACTSALDPDALPWTTRDRVRVEQTWISRAPFERDALKRALDRLDAQTDAWTSAAHETCEAPEPELSLVACLQQQRDAIAAAADVIGSSGEQDPIRVVSSLTAPSACSDPSSLQDVPPPGIADEVATQRRKLARADASRLAGRRSVARTLAQEVLDAADDLQFVRLQLSARLQLALLDELETAPLLALAHDAMAAGHDDLAASALLQLATSTSVSSGRHEQGLAFVDLAEAALRRCDRYEIERDALLLARVNVLRLAHRDEELVALFESVPDPPPEPSLYAGVASSLVQLGRPADAREAAETAVAHAREQYGSSHVATLAVELELASIMRIHDPTAAERLHREIWTRLERDVGRDHEAWFAATNGLAVNVQRNHGYEQAAPLWDELLAAVKTRYGEGTLMHALVLNNVASGLTNAGRSDEAAVVARRALAIREEKLPASHYHIAASLDRLGTALVSIGEHEEGDAVLLRAIEIWRRSPLQRVVYPLTTLARSELEQGRPRDALRRLDDALAIAETSGHHGWPRNEIHLARARALHELGRFDEARTSASAAVIDDPRGERPPANVLAEHVNWLQRAGVLP